MAGKDYYKILGVDKKASADEIKKAFRRKARQYHPDVKPDDQEAEKKFKEINEAYEILSDEKKRKDYDTFGDAAFQAGGGPGPGGFHPGGQAEGFDFSDLFGGAAGGSGGRTFTFRSGGGGGPEDISDIFGNLFGGGAGFHQGQTTATSRRGENAEHQVEIDFREAVRGTELKLRIDGKKVNVKVPPGTADNTRLRLKGKGHPGINGGPNGDLILTIKVRPDHTFRMQGKDLYCKVKVPLTTALLGGKIEVPTFDGKAMLTIKECAQNGQKMRLRGKGVKGRDGSCGDQIVELEIIMPKRLTPKARKLVEELAQELD
ncbi:MAG: J domain-containing protein [Deltaproteobacteria bacterium]|nr:J domain-containing protein [Deltaproteobacteria bacterium]